MRPRDCATSQRDMRHGPSPTHVPQLLRFQQLGVLRVRKHAERLHRGTKPVKSQLICSRLDRAVAAPRATPRAHAITAFTDCSLKVSSGKRRVRTSFATSVSPRGRPRTPSFRWLVTCRIRASRSRRSLSCVSFRPLAFVASSSRFELSLVRESFVCIFAK